MIVTLGETMALLTSEQTGPMRRSSTFRLGIAGAESNMAIGAARLGAPVTWCSRLGDDEFGRLIAERLRADGVDVRAAIDPDAPTGLMLKEPRAAGVMNVAYYRRGSAASRMTPDDVDTSLIASARVLHVGGITPALGDGPAAAIAAAIDAARSSGVRVSFDVNFRSRLWSSDAAAPVLRKLAADADIVFASEDEADMVWGSREPEAIGAPVSIVKRGRNGASVVVEGVRRDAAGIDVTELDPVGAGDAFAAGWLAALILGDDPLETANRLGAYAVTVPGDCEGLPTRAELRAWNSEPGRVSR